ncbi:hypothetical protein QYF36_003274 [Acer negundo]|nr:hypothetical protein QYF36_003274 [Acer negundo]
MSISTLVLDAIKEMLLTMQDMFLHNMKLGIFFLATCLVFFQKAYKAPSIEAFRQGKFAATRIDFMGFEFLKEVISFLLLCFVQQLLNNVFAKL